VDMETKTIRIISAGELTRHQPESFALHQNYPNPFNPETIIRYDLPEAVSVKLIIYNMLGEEVRTLVNQIQEAGSHKVTWDGRDSNGSRAATGIYIYKMVAGDFIAVNKMILMR